MANKPNKPNITPKQEAFARSYVETSNASESYRRAYDAENMKPEVIWKEASILLADRKVSVRVMELQEVARDLHEVTLESIALELDENRKSAKEWMQGAAMNGATLGKAKLYGLVVEKQEHTGKDGKPIESTVTHVVDPDIINSVLDKLKGI